jgi:hypothetical protein
MSTDAKSKAYDLVAASGESARDVWQPIMEKLWKISDDKRTLLHRCKCLFEQCIRKYLPTTRGLTEQMLTEKCSIKYKVKTEFAKYLLKYLKANEKTPCAPEKEDIDSLIPASVSPDKLLTETQRVKVRKETAVINIEPRSPFADANKELAQRLGAVTPKVDSNNSPIKRAATPTADAPRSPGYKNLANIRTVPRK